ncbi:unnamed protein product, partial [Ceratitis capitata]
VTRQPKAMHDNSCNLSQSGLLDLTENFVFGSTKLRVGSFEDLVQSDKIWSTNDAGDDEH